MSLTLDSVAGSEREEKLTWMKGSDISGLSCLRETIGPMRIVEGKAQRFSLQSRATQR